MNTAVHLVNESIRQTYLNDPVVIIGTGPVGIKTLFTLLEKDPQTQVVIYGDEPWEPYNRVKLSSLLAGETGWSDLIESQKVPQIENLVQHQNCRVVEIDRERNTVIDSFGREQRYRKLILALGSNPHIPSVDGIELENIYTFRNMTDAQHLMARQVKSRRVIVVGGGVLGLEAAKAMSRNKTEVTVIDHAQYLMPAQLDEEAAELLREHILVLGIKVYLGVGIKKILGDTKVTGVELRNGEIKQCDTLILSTGIKSNVELARKAKIHVGRGVRVSDTMQTNDPDIYAVGECAEHREIVYGLVAPGFEQAKVAVADIHKQKTAYRGSIMATQLKVVGLPVFSMGRTGEGESKSIFNQHVFAKPGSQTYRKIIIFRNRLVGAISVGKWDSLHRIQESITKQRYIFPWQLKRFVTTGDLWPKSEGQVVAQWPANAIVCQCMNVTRGQCSKAITTGCETVEAVMQKTSASTVCGGCRPLLAELIGGAVQAEKIKSFRSIFLYSLLVGLAALIAFLSPGVTYNESSIQALQWDVVWRDGVIKQVTGFSILGLTLLGLLVALRKRWKRFSLFEFSFWRYVHIFIGVFIVLTLLMHTGFRLGNNINAWLMSLFTGLILVGGVYGVFMSLQYKLDGVLANKIKGYMNWIHLLLFWPVPVLLTFHIIKTYYF